MNDDLMVFEEPDVIDLAELVVTGRQAVDDLEGKLEEAKAQLETTESALIEAMKNSGLSSFRKDGRGFSYSERTFVSVPAERRSEQFEWLQEIGAGDMIKPTVHSGSFQSMINKDFLQQGLEVPGFVNVFKRDVLSVGE